jgi:hypothetical protein
MKTIKVQYFAGTLEIMRMGPYKNEVEAWEALRGHDGVPVQLGRVWPERVHPKRAKK